MKSIQLFSYINNSNPEEMIKEKEMPIKELSVSHPESIMTICSEREQSVTLIRQMWLFLCLFKV